MLAIELAKSLDVHRDPPTPSPRTAVFLKRKFEQESDSETEDGGDGDVGMEGDGEMGGGNGEVVGGGERGGEVEMSGALQVEDGGDDMHLYSDD